MRHVMRERGTARLGHSAFRLPSPALVVVLAACSPVTTRPAFFPYPQALSVVLEAPPARVVPEAAGWLVSQGLKVQWSSPQDGYVETAWYDTRTRSSSFSDADASDLLSTVKIRCWIDPNISGKSQLTVEAVYRPMLDPSRPERDLEQIAPDGSDGYRLAQQLIDAMTQRFGK
jgi:hypothetical protein